MKGYDELNKFFCKDRGFEHRQESVYCSKNKMPIHDVFDLVQELRTSCPWMKKRLTRMDVADVGGML